MRRATPTLPITPGMLRHFAVLTLVITSCIAIFAQGENREFVLQQTQAHAKKGGAAQAPAAPAAKPQTIGGLVIGSGTRISNGTSDYDEKNDQPGGGDGGGSGSGSGSIEAGASSKASFGPLIATQPGQFPPQPANDPQGSPPKYNPGQRNGPTKAQPPRKVTPQDIERMLAAARERSGVSSPE